MGISSLSTKNLIACVAIIVEIYLKSPANSTIYQVSFMSSSEIYESIWAWEREWLGVRHSSIWMPTLPLMYSVTHLLICKTGNTCWQYVLQKIIWWFLERTLCKALPGPGCPTLGTPWTVPFQFPLSIRSSRQEYWRGELFPSSGDLPNPRIKPGSPALQEDSLPSETPRKPPNFKEWEPLLLC